MSYFISETFTPSAGIKTESSAAGVETFPPKYLTSGVVLKDDVEVFRFFLQADDFDVSAEVFFTVTDVVFVIALWKTICTFNKSMAPLWYNILDYDT